jgi:predicted  nucleic acid-binding Zn-ribbon protein
MTEEDFRAIGYERWMKGKTMEEKDARIAELEQAYDIVQNHLIKAEQRIAELEKLNLMTDDELVLTLKERIAELEKRIAKLADFLCFWSGALTKEFHAEAEALIEKQ